MKKKIDRIKSPFLAMLFGLLMFLYSSAIVKSYLLDNASIDGIIILAMNGIAGGSFIFVIVCIHQIICEVIVNDKSIQEEELQGNA